MPESGVRPPSGVNARENGAFISSPSARSRPAANGGLTPRGYLLDQDDVTWTGTTKLQPGRHAMIRQFGRIGGGITFLTVATASACGTENAANNDLVPFGAVTSTRGISGRVIRKTCQRKPPSDHSTLRWGGNLVLFACARSLITSPRRNVQSWIRVILPDDTADFNRPTSSMRYQKWVY
jgi:hypothetical protein